MQSCRLIIYHKHPTSARTRFFKLSHGGVCGVEPLPVPAQLLDPPDTSVVSHPAKLVGEMEKALGLAAGGLEVDGEFHAWVDVARGPIEVFLARFTDFDPPFEAIDEAGGELIDLAGGRSLAPVELELLRKAYECVMEG
jgi:hypothetical protein